MKRIVSWKTKKEIHITPAPAGANSTTNQRLHHESVSPNFLPVLLRRRTYIAANSRKRIRQRMMTNGSWMDSEKLMLTVQDRTTRKKYTQQQEQTKCFCEDNNGALLVGINRHFHHRPRP